MRPQSEKYRLREKSRNRGRKLETFFDVTEKEMKRQRERARPREKN